EYASLATQKFEEPVAPKKSRLRVEQFQWSALPLLHTAPTRCCRFCRKCLRPESACQSADSTNSRSKPPVLEGWTNTYSWPPAPVLISSDTRRTPSRLSLSTVPRKSGTRKEMWCRPSPRFATNLPITESSEVG